MKIVPIVILTCNRPIYLEQTIASLMQRNGIGTEPLVIARRGNTRLTISERSFALKIYIVVQGYDEETHKILEKYEGIIEEVKWLKENVGSSDGATYALRWMVDLGFDYIIFSEDDLFSGEPVLPYLEELIQCFETYEDVGYIRLRAVLEKVAIKNRITGKRMRYVMGTKNIRVGNYHYPSYPVMVRASIINKITPVANSLEGMKKYHALGLRGGQLVANCFYHIGYQRAYVYNEKQERVWIS